MNLTLQIPNFNNNSFFVNYAIHKYTKYVGQSFTDKVIIIIIETHSIESNRLTPLNGIAGRLWSILFNDMNFLHVNAYFYLNRK